MDKINQLKDRLLKIQVKFERKQGPGAESLKIHENECPSLSTTLAKISG